MIIEVDRADDQRLDAFRWRERQLTTIAQRRNAIGEGQFIAEGDLVVERALAAGCTPEHVLCDPKTAQRFSDRIATAGGVTLVATADIRRCANCSPRSAYQSDIASFGRRHVQLTPPRFGSRTSS